MKSLETILMNYVPPSKRRDTKFDSDDGIVPEFNTKKPANHTKWGNWEYIKGVLHWRGKNFYEIPKPVTQEDAVEWIAHMHDKNWCSCQDLKDLAQALGELLQCPMVVKAYRTTYRDYWLISRLAKQENFSTCERCSERFKCLTLLPNKKVNSGDF
jgi:hypothetical protein